MPRSKRPAPNAHIVPSVSTTNSRDEFREDVKLLLARRVGSRCSNPNCRLPTSGPADDPLKVTNIGVAAHITAAAKDGPRYDGSMTTEERRAPENGIWLCQTHAKLIDSDDRRYTVGLIKEWKRLAELAARLDLERPAGISQDKHTEDIQLLRFFSQCFDRPAFQEPFAQEGSMEAFDRAMTDTIIAINTGCLRSRDGLVLSQARGKSFLNNELWRVQMDTIIDMLKAIRSRYETARLLGQIYVRASTDRHEFHCINDRSLAEWMDYTRTQIVSAFSRLCQEAGIPQLRFPRQPWSREPS